MVLYKRKPPIDAVDAVQLDAKSPPPIVCSCKAADGPHLHTQPLTVLRDGDWILQDPTGVVWVEPAETFSDAYEPATAEEQARYDAQQTRAEAQVERDVESIDATEPAPLGTLDAFGETADVVDR